MLSMFRVIGCHNFRCTHFKVKLWIKPELTENIYTELFETAEPDLNQVGFIWISQL